MYNQLLNLPIKQQMLLIHSIKCVYEDMLKRKDYAAIEELKNAIAFTSADGITLNPEAAVQGRQAGRKDLLSVLQTMLANVRKIMN